MWVNITFTIYGTESYLVPQTLELTEIMGTHRTPISGHAQTLPPNRHVYRTKEHPGHSQRTPPSEHAHRTS